MAHPPTIPTVPASAGPPGAALPSDPMNDAAPYFEVDREPLPNGRRLVAQGELDAASSDVLEGELADALASQGQVELDLAKVSFIDSSGLRVITSAVRAAEDAGATLVITEASEAVRRIFEMTGLTPLLGS